MQRSAWDPTLLQSNEFLKALCHFWSGELSEPKLLMRLVHSFKVLVWSEKHHTFIMSDVSLESLKAFDTIVQSGISRVKLKRLISLYNGLLPSSIMNIVVDLEHVIG